MKKLININELSEKLGISRFTIYKYISKRVIPYIKIGNRVMFNPDDIEQYLRDHTIYPISVNTTGEKNVIL